MLENVSHTTTALDMWLEICNVYQRHTLLNKLAERRDFYTAKMKEDEKMLVYVDRVRKMASTLQSMDATINDKEMAMAVLNGLPPRFETLITALEAIGHDYASFLVHKDRSRLLQEKRGPTMRTKSKKTESEIALLNRSQDPSGTPNKKEVHALWQDKPHRTIPLEEAWASDSLGSITEKGRR